MKAGVSETIELQPPGTWAKVKQLQANVVGNVDPERAQPYTDRHHYRTVDESQIHFTWRAVFVGLLFGTILCFSNMYFGLQTGWISMMSLQSSLVGFAVFKALDKFLVTKFGPAENVVLQTTAVATATMPLAAGFVGILPAIKQLEPDETHGAQTELSYGQLCAWGLALTFFGVFFAVPLRKQTIIREKLRFPSGTATAQMISVLHNRPDPTFEEEDEQQRRRALPEGHGQGFIETQSQLRSRHDSSRAANSPETANDTVEEQPLPAVPNNVVVDVKWVAKLLVLLVSFLLSGAYTLIAHFYPILSSLPVFGKYLKDKWLWTLTPSLSYAGQGIIMGLPTCIWMLVGALVGWGILSPIAKNEGWAPGAVGDWKNGSRGWILWVSLAVMIAESLVSLSLITWKECRRWVEHYQRAMGRRRERKRLLDETTGGDEQLQSGGSRSPRNSYGVAGESSQQTTPGQSNNVSSFKPMAVTSGHDGSNSGDDEESEDVDPRYLVPGWVIWGGLLASTLLCMGIVKAIFNIPMYDTLIAVLLALPLAVLGVRALGETDLNPVSGIGKVSQVIFAGVMPGNIIGNLVAGGIAEAGAQQAGDLMQDLKTGHLLHASPRAQFVAQMIGSVFSVFVSAGAYKLYNRVYQIPGPQFPVPTGQVWLDMARLVNGRPLPPHVWPFIAVFAAIFVALPIALVLITKSGKKSWQVGRFSVSTQTVERWWPSGIAFAIGIYNTPNFTLMRAIGAVVAASVTEVLVARNRRNHALSVAEEQLYRRKVGMLVIILASGFVLGEGTFSFGILIFEAFL